MQHFLKSSEVVELLSLTALGYDNACFGCEASARSLESISSSLPLAESVSTFVQVKDVSDRQGFAFF